MVLRLFPVSVDEHGASDESDDDVDQDKENNNLVDLDVEATSSGAPKAKSMFAYLLFSFGN